MNSLGLDYESSSASGDDSSEHESVRGDVQLLQPSSMLTQDRKPATHNRQTKVVIDGVPAEPPGKADPTVQARIAQFLELQREKEKDDQDRRIGGDAGASANSSRTHRVKSFQENLQTKKEVANPYILDKVVEYFGIDEVASNFDASVFDPYALPLHEYSEKIAVEQNKRRDDRVRDQAARTRVQFVGARHPE